MQDCTLETLQHIKTVANNLTDFSISILQRAKVHDDSKLCSPEKEIFDEYTPILNTLEYGSPEYKENLEKIKPAIDHHYQCNSHHPEFIFTKEIWDDIPEFEGFYQVSNLGRIKSLDREIVRETQGNFLKPGGLMNLNITPKGYVRVQLRKNGKYKNYFVHTLVAKVFIGQCDDVDYQVNHIDGNKQNNNSENLEWITASGNIKHAYENDLLLPNLKYVVYCKEEDITTFGLEKMKIELIKKGYNNISAGGIWRCINSNNEESSHLGLHFESHNIDEYKQLNSPLNNMDLFDVIEMYCDWVAAIQRTKNGNFDKSLKINEYRFGIDPQLIQIFRNTYNKNKK